jgi:hypothetical protein
MKMVCIKLTKKFGCCDCNTEFDTKPDKCPKCGSTNIKKTRYFEVFRIQVREESGKKPVSETVTKQRLGRNGKQARVTIAVDRNKKTYTQNVEQQDENGNWKSIHQENESIEEHNKKKQKRKRV